MPNQKELNYKKITIISIIVFIVISIVFIVVTIINHLKSAQIQILVAPTFAKVQIDGKTYPSSKSLNFFPSDNELTANISADGFISQEVKITPSKNSTSYIYVVLEHESDDTWYNATEKETDRKQAVLDSLSSAEVEKFVQKYPVTSILPYINNQNNITTYRIDYGNIEGCKADICLKITDYTGENKENALKYLSDNGFNPDNFEIIYENTAQNYQDNPITNYLPFKTLFDITYNYSASNELLIAVESPQTYFDEAITKLKEFSQTAYVVGSNKTIAEYNIKFNYSNFSNPFENTFVANSETDPINYIRTGFSNINPEYNFQIQQGTQEGNYYYTTVTIGSYSQFSQVTFRIILVKNNDSWQLSSSPQPIITTTHAKEIPLDILNKVNALPFPKV